MMKPAPVNDNSLPPTNDELMAVNVGLDVHVFVNVDGVTLWYPR